MLVALQMHCIGLQTQCELVHLPQRSFTGLQGRPCEGS